MARSLRSVGARLSLALAAVVAGALAVVWVALVPTLQHRLVVGRLSLLAQSARQIERSDTAVRDQDFIDDAARTADANRVVLYSSTPAAGSTVLQVLADSRRTGTSLDVQRDPIAQRAAKTQALQRGELTRNGERFAEVAVPQAGGFVLLFAASLRATLRNVELVRDRLIWGGLIALGLSALVGFGAASAFARRIRRLERAADRIAAGDFGEPVVDRGRDELGELATAFDHMRSQLARLDDARRAFIANASHELRTPIFSLGGFLELLQEDDLDDRTRADFIAAMSEQTARLAKLATDLLDLSRLDAGGMRIDLQEVPLGEVTTDLVEEFSAVAARAGSPLEASVADAGVVHADRERVLQVGRALVENALVHTPAGTRVLVTAAGNALIVEDEGPGIPAEHQEQVFARFTRLDGTRAAGTGLGLAIARELAERMGGELRLESRPGRTSFAVVLPAALRVDQHEVIAAR
jgi:two-component system, OmpR family, sensor kinase